MRKGAEPLPPNYRWNFAVIALEYVCFGIALTFSSRTSVLPAFVRQLTDSAPVVGLIGAIFRGGWTLPQALVARMVSDKKRKKPYILIGSVGRITFLLTALALWAGLARHPTAMLILFFVGLGVFAIGLSVTSVGWFDVMARSIPGRRRGRLMGVSQVISATVGIGVGALVGRILVSPRWRFPTNYALLFTITGTFLVIGAIALALIREPPPEGASPQTSARAKGRWLRFLIEDVAFRRLIVCRIMIGMAELATPFYVGHAEDVLHLQEGVIGSFIIAHTLARIVGSAALGLTSERRGPRYVVHIASAAAVIGPLFALVAHVASSRWLGQAYPFVYVMLGIVDSAWLLGFTNYMLEIAPAGMRPTYIGMGGTISGVLAFAPILGGWLLEVRSYATLFGVTALLTAVGFILSLRLVPSHSVARGEN